MGAQLHVPQPENTQWICQTQPVCSCIELVDDEFAEFDCMCENDGSGCCVRCLRPMILIDMNSGAEVKAVG